MQVHLFHGIMTLAGIDFMILPRLYPIVSTDALEKLNIGLEQASAALLEAGVQILQLRHKGHWSRQLFQQAEWLQEQCRQAGIQFVINDRADIARILGATLHIGQDDLCPSDARLVIGSELLLGFSTHNEQQLIEADKEPVDYLALGPIFGTASKENPDPTVGCQELGRLRPLTQKPLVAIGGIHLQNVAEVFEAGADSVAIISGLLSDPNQIRQTTELWLKTLHRLPARN